MRDNSSCHFLFHYPHVTRTYYGSFHFLSHYPDITQYRVFFLYLILDMANSTYRLTPSAEKRRAILLRTLCQKQPDQASVGPSFGIASSPSKIDYSL